MNAMGRGEESENKLPAVDSWDNAKLVAAVRISMKRNADMIYDMAIRHTMLNGFVVTHPFYFGHTCLN